MISRLVNRMCFYNVSFECNIGVYVILYNLFVTSKLPIILAFIRFASVSVSRWVSLIRMSKQLVIYVLFANIGLRERDPANTELSHLVILVSFYLDNIQKPLWIINYFWHLFLCIASQMCPYIIQTKMTWDGTYHTFFNL